METRTDDGRGVITTAHTEPSAQVSLTYKLFFQHYDEIKMRKSKQKKKKKRKKKKKPHHRRVKSGLGTKFRITLCNEPI